MGRAALIVTVDAIGMLEQSETASVSATALPPLPAANDRSQSAGEAVSV